MAEIRKHQFAEMEERLIKQWADEQTFEQSVAQREGQERVSFFDGPPYANGLPHHGHVVPGAIKDALVRYKTMRGYYVPRRAGWDTHGLPVENKIEKELGLSTKKDIIAYGIDKFNAKCRESVFKYKTEWEQFIARLGRSIDTKNAYATLDNSYIESVWWVFSELWKKDLVYQGYRSMPYCPRCATPLSNFEVNQGYQDNVKDPSLFVKFQLKGEPRKLLAWTTTPWSLPGNAAIAVHPGEIYVTVHLTAGESVGERLILSQKRLEVLADPYEVEAEVSGTELVGLTYEPLFQLDPKAFPNNGNAYKVWSADFVSVEEGSGVLHVAPAFGEDDLNLGLEYDVPVFSTVNEHGEVREGIRFHKSEQAITGVFFKTADKLIIEGLTEEAAVYSAETFLHTYPFCWRCDTPLLYYAVTTWFVAVTKLKEQLIANNQQINWIPAHVKAGRFGNWLEDVRDWSIARNRFWGAPLPIWKCEQGHHSAFGSIEQLNEAATKKLPVTADLHRPFIDDVVVICSECDAPARRVEEVFDVWFESGSMPYAQDHYPFENKELVEQTLPADFIAESIDQTRGWFYTLLVLSTALFDKPMSKNTVVSGWVVAADGQKLSKRLKNYAPLDEVFDQYGADTLRLFMLMSPVVAAEDVRFSKDLLSDVQRGVFMTLWNTKNFLTTYAKIDNWQPGKEFVQPNSSNLLDDWLLARLNQTIAEVTTQADAYRLPKATRPIAEFIDDLSNWYVRRSRRRFWKSEDDEDKASAYATLHFVLMRTTQLLAPWAPFMSDQIYRELAPGMDLPASVHLTDWPEPQGDADDDQLLLDMRRVREVIAEGLAQRAAAGIKVRQPLQEVTVISEKPIIEAFSSLIAEELNVKNVSLLTGAESAVTLNTELTAELRAEGLMREVVRQVQQLRKERGLQVDDRIELFAKTEDEALAAAITKFKADISRETLTATFANASLGAEPKQVQVEGKDLLLELRIAKG